MDAEVAEFGAVVENDLAPCPRAAEQMAAYDALPAEFRRFLMHYPRTCKATQAAVLLRACGGNVAEAMDEIRAHLPVRRAA